jgi:hypothetical protein
MHPARLLATVLAAFATAAVAAPPDACTLITMEEVNTIAAGVATKFSQRRAGNPSECAFEDNRRAAVLVLIVREVQYAAENELQHERETLEKIYRNKVKWIEGVGESAFWLAANKTAMFRKAKRIVTVSFARPQNANEVDTIQAARLIESRLQ